MKDQKAVPVKGEDFDGLYSRGVSGNAYNPEDPCPKNGWTTANQARFTPWGVQARPGYEDFPIFSAIINIVQILPYHTNQTGSPGSVVNGYFIVEQAGGATNIYDSNASVPGTPIDTIAGTWFVSFIVLFGRIAFTFHDYSVGALTSYQVYKPGWAASRDNGGTGPSLAGVNFASSGTAGIVTQGVHVFGLAYETDSGHITALSTTGGTDVNFFTLANANQQVTATGLPAAFPAGITSLHILASRLVVNSSGNPVDYEIFFVHEVTAAAASVTFNFSDESLVDSADYLYDLFGSLYGQLGFTWYANRLIAWGEQYNSGFTEGPSVLRISESGLPESFSISHGVLPVFQDDGDTGIKNCWEYKGLLIIQKESRTFVTRDNGDEPNTWQVDILDGTIGSIIYGIAKTSNQVGAIRTDFTITISKNGVYLFDGKFNEIPLTWKIERLWQQQSERGEYLTFQILDIPTAKMFIILGWETIEDVQRALLFVCDYSKGLSYQTVRWSIWRLTHRHTWIAMEDATNMRMVARTGSSVDNMIIGTASSELVEDRPGNSIDNGNLITGELNFDDEMNQWHYLQVRLRGVISGAAFNWITLNGTTVLVPPNPLTPQETDIWRIILNEKAYFPQFNITFSSNGVETFFRLKQLCYFGQKYSQDLLGQ